uniref:Uncharacterized protein n=1 Tax=Panagrolaimus superbus TaxID=310955 RepID=A0A914YFZ2_9BILA
MGKDGREPIHLFDEVTEKVVEQRAIRDPVLIKKLYKNHKSLKCRTSKLTNEFGNQCNQPHGCFWTDSSIGEVKTTYVAGCIDIIPKLLEKNSSNPIFRALQTCVTISKLRSLNKLDEKEKQKEPFRCFGTNEINFADSNDKNQLTNVFIVCCCTELDERGRCDKKDRTKKSYGAKVMDVGNNNIENQHKNQIYSVPF